MLTDDVANVPVDEVWRLKAATPPAARSEIATTADHRKVFDMVIALGQQSTDFACNETSKFESIPVAI